MIRRTLSAFALASLLLVALAGQALAAPLHLHCLTTPGGTHSIGRGVTMNAPHDPAFDALHTNVHVGAFSMNPNTLVPGIC